MSAQRELKFVPIARIRHNPVALRTVEKETVEYRGLVDSIIQKGVLSPISVREITNPDPNDTEPLYGLIDGLHRFTASQDAGKDKIPCQIVTMDDAEVLEAQIVANAHVVTTKPVAYAKQLQRMIAANPALIASEVAGRLGMSTTWLSDRLGLPKLIQQCQELVDSGEITLTNAFALSKLPAELQPNFVERAMTQSPSEFVPAAQKAKKEYDNAKRQGRDPNQDAFQPIEKLQKLAIIKDELTHGKLGPALIAKHNIHSPAQAFAFAIKWVLNADPDSIEAQKLKHEARVADNKKKKDEAKAERERLAAEKASKKQAEIQLAPGVTMTKKPEAVTA